MKEIASEKQPPGNSVQYYVVVGIIQCLIKLPECLLKALVTLDITIKRAIGFYANQGKLLTEQNVSKDCVSLRAYPGWSIGTCF